MQPSDSNAQPLLLRNRAIHRRNLWGLRPIGFVISALSSVVTGVSVYMRWQATGNWSLEVAGVGGVGIIFLLLWAFRFSPDWVRSAADAYAARLVESIETMSAAKSAAAKK